MILRNDLAPQFLLGALLGIIVSFGARALGLLTVAGGRAAATVGTLTFGVGGPVPALLLVAFFVSASALSRYGRALKETVLPKFAKGDARDQGQVWANGGVPAALAVAYGLTGHPFWLAGMAGALAAATADTWATELGVLSGKPPRLITTWKQVEPGSSGALSLQGTAATAAGAGSMALLAAALMGDRGFALPVFIGGVLGAGVDSILGATVQGAYWCPSCEIETEQWPLHSCGHETAQKRGWRWLGNDQVNLAASLVGGMTALALWGLR